MTIPQVVDGVTDADAAFMNQLVDAANHVNELQSAIEEISARDGGGLPDQSGQSGKFLTTDGTDASWGTPAGGGDMSASTYDPNAVADDAFDMDNMVEGATNKILTASERSAIASAAQDLGDLGVTASASELNTLDGITASTEELNILDGVTASASELNVLDGITATVTELNYVDGVTSAIQTQLDGKQASDADLTAIAAITPSDNDIIQRISGSWVARSMAQLKTALGLTKGDVGLGNVDNTSDATKNAAAATLANKTLTTPTIASMANANHNHTNSAGGGQLTDAALSAAVGIAKGGTGQTTAQNARNALLPTQSGNAGKVLISNGTDVSWAFQEQFGPHLYVATRWYDNLFLYGEDESGGMNFIPNNISAMPFFFSTPLTITGFRVRRTNTSGTDTVSIAIYDWGHFASSGPRVGSQGQISISTTTGWYSVTGLSIAIPSPGWYLIAFHSGNNGCSYETRQFVMTTPWGSASGSTDQDSLMQMDSGYSGGMPSTFTPTGYWRPGAVSFPVVQFQVSS